MPTLDLTQLINPVEYEPQESYKHEIYTTPLADGYEHLALGGSTAQLWNWRISKTNLTWQDKDLIANTFKDLAGTTPFLWTPKIGIVPKSSYICTQWNFTPIAPDLSSPTTQQIWKFDATFELETSGECEAFRNLISKSAILIKLSQAIGFQERYTQDIDPMTANSDGSIRNAFHKVAGRGGYFHYSSSTSEGVFLTIYAFAKAFKVTNNVRYKNYALFVANYALNYIYPKPDPFSYTIDDKFLCHWLVNAGDDFFVKGKINEEDYFKGGWFDINVNFNNGVGIVPNGNGLDRSRLANVYLVHSGKLYYQNVFSPIIPGSGTVYPVDYWVSNQYMEGTVFRLFPASAESGGQSGVPTNELPGTIKLKSNFTGTLKVVLSTYETTMVPRNGLYDAFPFFRENYKDANGNYREFNFATDAGFWIADSFKELAEIDPANAAKWLKCVELNQRDYLRFCVNIPNLAYWYKKDVEENDPYAYAGTQTVSIRSGQTVTDNYTISRVITGALAGTARINYTSTPANTFPSIEFIQNYASQFIIGEDSKIRVEAATTRGYNYEVTLSASSDAFDFSRLFIANWLLDGNSTLVTKNFEPEHFVRWGESGKPYLVWHPTIVDFPNPLYVYFDENGSSATRNRDKQDIPINGKNIDAVTVWRSVLDKGTGTHAGFGYVISEGKKIKNPPRICYRHTGDDVILKIIDGQDNEFTKRLESSNGWVKRSFQWDDFDGEDEPSSNGFIKNIQFELAEDSDNATVWTYWIAENERNEPELLSDLTPVKTYKGAIVGRIPAENYTFWVGDFKPINSPSEALKYNPGVPAFTNNIIDGNIDAYLGGGCPLIGGYISLYHLYIWGAQTEFNNCIKALKDSQAAYANKVGVSGPFAPYYIRDYWDANSFANQYGAGNWIEFGIDPNGGWTQYQSRTVDWAARALHADPDNWELREIVRKFLVFIDNHFTQYKTNRVPTYYSLNAYPTTTYHEPATCALVGRAAIYANLAGLSPQMTWRIIYRCYTYIESQWVGSGTMAGSWSAGQPKFTDLLGEEYNEWFCFWGAEIIDFYCTLHQYLDQLTLPSCASLL